jgi:hypothetical protein
VSARPLAHLRFFALKTFFFVAAAQDRQPAARMIDASVLHPNHAGICDSPLLRQRKQQRKSWIPTCAGMTG